MVNINGSIVYKMALGIAMTCARVSLKLVAWVSRLRL